jgi:hypothetical protein
MQESDKNYTPLFKQYDSVRLAFAEKYPKLKSDKATQDKCDAII